MLPSHALAVALAALVLQRLGVPFGRREWALALAFGVAIDLDHLLQVPSYVQEKGSWGALLDLAGTSAWGAAWQGAFHRPEALAVVLVAAVALRSWVPPAAWALHMAQDFVVARHFVAYGSRAEWTVVAGLALAVVLLVRARRAPVPRRPGRAPSP